MKFDQSQINLIELEKKDEKIALQKNEKGWSLIEPIQDQADNDQIEEFLKKSGGPADWMIYDIPKKAIMFVKSPKNVAKNTSKELANVLLDRDPVKITMENGEVKLLGEVENSLISKLFNSNNFIPNVYCSTSAYELLLSHGVIEGSFS